MFRKIATDMNFAAREEEVLAFWDREAIRDTAQHAREGAEQFVVYDGPPTANGKPHIGHVLTRAIKDVIPRYRRMKGYDVQFKAGWDTHGLPVELEVEKSLGLDGKDEIEAYGVEAFVKACKESVWVYKGEWEDISRRTAYWADMEHPYVTYENSYIESEWWALKKMWEKGLIYNGHKIVPYCPRCGTSLSSHEVAQGYKDVKERSAYVRFKVKGTDNTWFTAWTTTPWTLPSNVALVVNPDETYVLVEPNRPAADTDKEHGAHVHALPDAAYAPVGDAPVRYYIAEALADELFEAGYTVVERMTGKELEGMDYEPILPYAKRTVEASGKRGFYVISADYVTMDEGTGIVHTAPAFGEDDYRTGRRHDLPFAQLVDTEGKLTEDVTDFAGMDCKAADPLILEKLADEGSLLVAPPFEHAYPHCWRCDTPLIYYARASWFIEMTKVRDALLANNNTVDWMPETVRDGRFGKFLENVVDWNLSRERYWGTPLPMWQCTSCDHEQMIGSVEELRSLAKDCPEDLELHKPYIDQVELTCPECGAPMRRIPEVIDTWFDSGSMPFAQYHYPFENKAYFDARFPADFISEAQDQTRGWFYSLMAIATVIFDQSPFRHCIVLGLVQDEDGQKMSKSKGNVVDPWDAIERFGADAVRWYFYANSNPWLPSRFSADAVLEFQRKYMATFWNTLAFFTMYAGLDGFDPRDPSLPEPEYTLMDRWLMSRLHTLIRDVDDGLDGYDITRAARSLQDFADELSNWYVRRGRDRFWGADMTPDKSAAYLTLYTALDTVTRLTAPFTPFMAEQAWRELAPGREDGAPISVHLADFPVCDPDRIDEDLETDMAEVQRLVTLGHAARNSAQMKTRQPLANMLVYARHPLDEALQAIVLDELNVKAMTFVDDADELLDYRVKPQLRTLGRRLGSLIPVLQRTLNDADGTALVADMKAHGHVTLDLDGTTVRLEPEDLLVESEPKAGFSTAQDSEATVALDLTLDETLRAEGLMREIVSKVQTMRKDAGFEVEDRIRLYYRGDDAVTTIVARYADEIARQVLATDMVHDDTTPDGVTYTAWELNGHHGELAVERLEPSDG